MDWTNHHQKWKKTLQEKWSIEMCQNCKAYSCPAWWSNSSFQTRIRFQSIITKDRCGTVLFSKFQYNFEDSTSNPYVGGSRLLRRLRVREYQYAELTTTTEKIPEWSFCVHCACRSQREMSVKMFFMFCSSME